jgi:hypothetical protein
MYKNFFRIGFGGCGCALVDTFEEHVYRLFRSYLLEEYKKLAKLSKVFSEDDRIKMKANLDRLKELIFKEKLDLDNLDNIEKHLGEWGAELKKVKGGMKRSYEQTLVEKIESIINNGLNVRLAKIKKDYGVWLEALTVDSYSSGAKVDKHRYLYNKYLDDTRQIRISEFGMDILDAEGFDHQPELQMLPFSLQEVRNEVYTDLDSEIKKVNKRATRGHFFFLGLGGGTGTGVISPLAQEFSKGTRGYFTLGVLGGEDDNDYLNSQKPWFRRCFNMLLALNDLIVTAELDGLLLVDNKILMKNMEQKLKKRESIEITNNSNEKNLKKKLEQFLKNEFDIDEWVKDANIVISDNTQSITFTKDDDFAEIRISPASQEAKVIISDGSICTLEVFGKETEGKFYRTILGKTNEKRVDEELIKKIFLAFGHVACDQENLDWSQLGGAMDKFGTGKKKPIFVPCYASGEPDIASLIDIALSEGKLAKCAHKAADRVFVYLRRSAVADQEKESIKNKLKDIFLGDKDIGLEDTDIVEFIVPEERPDQLKEKLGTKKVIVIEVKERGNIKKNEVLILLRNPDIRDSLENRLTIAKNFVYLLKDFIKFIDGAKEPQLTERAKNIIKSKSAFFENKYLTETDKKIPTDGIVRYMFTWGNGKRFLTRQEQMNIKEYISQEFERDLMQADIRIENNRVFITNNKNEEAIITIVNKTCKVQFNGQERELKVKPDESGLRIYKEEKDLIKEILEEASRFLLPQKEKIKEIDKKNIYKRMKVVVERLFEGGKVDVNAAIKKLQEGDWPIFEERIFEIKQALASSAEIDVTTMLASEEISKALGPKTFEKAFFTYQTEALKALKDLNFVEGSDSDNYILTDNGEELLSALPLSTIDEEIEDPYFLFKKVPKQKFLHSSKKVIKRTDGNINFPKLVILSLLYTKWEYLFSLDKNKKDEKDKIKRYLTASKDPSLTVTGDSIFRWGEDGTGEILNISGGASGQIGILIDKEEGNNIKKIHVGSFRKKVNNNVKSIKEELDRGEINGLRDTLNISPPLPQQYVVVKEEGGYMILDDGDGNNNFYIYIQDNDSLRVYKDRSANLRVRGSKDKLKVYKRRGKKP